MNFDVQIAHSVEEVGQEAWDRLSGGRPFTSYRWYRFGEKAMAYAKPIYVILSLHGDPVARGTFWLTSRELLPISSSRTLYYLVTAVTRTWPLLMCQAPLASASTSGLILPDPPLRRAALETIAQAALELGRKYKVSFCIFPYLEAKMASMPDWPASFMPATIPEPGTRLDITWPDFESYLAHLSKKRRYNIRRNYRLAADLGIEVTCPPTVIEVDKALELHDQVNRRYNSPTEPWMRGAMEHAGMVDAAWLAARVGDRLVGCELMLGDQDTWFVTGLGQDYTTEYAYFMLGYADIKHAIELGARALKWGSLTYDVKLRLGFEEEDNCNLVFTSGAAPVRKFGAWLAQRERVDQESSD